ncbi:hypothetical protein [Streptomyces sp. Ac-502]|uniref:hypothetical protein n=1 Tax=Streptomyces sp. Ac-502 TaxID=3342801 RepID=UPI003862CD3D
MVFHNVFNSASNSAGLFTVTPGRDRPQPGADIDFEDADDDTYDDTSSSLFTRGIHGASSRAKIVQEQLPEARVVLGFLGAFIHGTQTSADTQAQYARNPGSVSEAAAAGMQKSSETVTDHSGLKKPDDLKDMPKKDQCMRPKAEAPKAEKAEAPKASAEKPDRPE